MFAAAVQRYFLRVYAQGLARSAHSAHWSPFAEATFQTVLIVIIPIAGLVATGIVLLGKTSFGVFMEQQRYAITVGSAVVFPLAAYIFVRKHVQGYRNSPQSAASFGATRDRVISNVQFWCVLVSSLALPWIAALSLQALR